MTKPATNPTLMPIVKTVTVKTTPEEAFRRVTTEMSTWWPFSSHSVGERNAESVTMESWVGGRIVERIRGGREAIWGPLPAWAYVLGLYAERRGPSMFLMHGLTPLLMSIRRRRMKSQPQDQHEA